MSIREGYKQTEIGVIPEEWEVLKFEQFFETVGSKKYQIQKQDYVQNGLIPVVDQGQKFIVSFSNDHEKILKNENGLIVFGDHTRIIKFINFDFIVGADGTQILKAKKTVDIKFAYYLLCAKEIVSLGYSRHFKLVKEFLYQCPPLSEQQKIAEILSTVDQKIDSIDSKIEETQILKRGLMQRLLSEGIGHSEFKESEIGRIPAGWEVVELGNVADILDPHPSHRAPKEDSNGFPFIGIGDINEKGDISLAGCRKVSLEDVLEQNNNIQINENDIGFGRVATVGKVVKFKRYDFPFALSPTMALIKSKNIDNGFLYQFLSSEFTKRQFRNFTSGSTRISLGIQNLRKLLISVPSFSEQKQIAEILSTADEKLETLRAKKEAFEILKKGLMQKLLSGEVRV